MTFSRLDRRTVAWIGGLFIAAIVALAAYDIVESYHATVASTGRELEAQARVIAEQTARSLQAVDVVLRHIVQEHRQGSLGEMSPRALHNYLREQAVGLVQVEGLLIIGPNARPRAVSLGFPLSSPDIDVSGFPIYQAMKGGYRGLYIDNAVKSPADGTWVFPMGRRLETPSGGFAGVASARGRIDYFEGFYRNLQFDEATAITLMHQNGTLLARHPRVESALGRHLAQFDRVAAVNTGPIRNVSPVDGIDRIGALKLVPDYPLAVVVTREASAALASWRAQSIGTGLRTLALSALALGLLLLLMRQLKRFDVTQERYALAVAGSDDGVWEYDFVKRRVYASARAREISGVPPGPEMQSIDEWNAVLRIHPEDAPRRKAAMDAHLAGEADAYEGEFRMLHPDGVYRWLRIHGLCMRDAAGNPTRMAGSTSDIDARKRAEEALRQSEERYALAVAGANDGIWDFDYRTRQVFASARTRELSGMPPGPDTVPMDEWLATVPLHPEDMPLRLRAIEDHLAGRTPAYEGEFRVRDGQGVYRWRRVHGLCIRNAQGEPIRMAGSISDIDAQKRAEEALRASEEQYRAVFDATTDALILRDGEGNIVDVNPAWMKMNGLTREQALSDRSRIFAPQSRHAEIRDLYRRARDGEIVRYELEVERAGGERAQLDVRLVPVRYRGERHSLSLARDITAQKRAEEALRTSEEQYREIFNAAADAFVLRDADARVIDVNPAFLALSGFTREEVVGKDRWIFAAPEQSAFAAEMHRRVIRGESTQAEIKARRKDGTPIDVEMRAVPVRYRGAPHALGMARDITAQKRAQAERARLEGQLLQAKKLEAIGTLAGGIAHDFNNILAAILGYGEMAQKNLAAGAPRKKVGRHLEAVVAAGMRAKSLVERILAFSRSGVGERLPVHVQSVVAEALHLVAASLPAHVRLERRLAAGDAAVMGDATQIHQVVMNLCANAAQAMKNPGTLSVTLEAAERDEAMAATSQLAAGRYVRLSVRDTGSGIPPSLLERIFDPFFTTREVGVGTGLGLSLVHGIVTDLGGGIDVESKLGAGTTFTIYLPWSGTAAVAAKTEETVPTGTGETVLLVDDEEALVRLGEEMIASLGYEPVGFTSSTAALAAFRAAPERFQAVLSDESMPEMSGSDLARAVRELRPGLPVVLMSGYVSPLFAARARNIGVVEVLAKPLVARDIARSLANALRSRHG